jgi:hypothetical protein
MGGVYELDEELSLYTIRERVPPPERQNIDSILWDLGLRTYDEFQLLVILHGRCGQDACELEEITEDISQTGTTDVLLVDILILLWECYRR